MIELPGAAGRLLKGASGGQTQTEYHRISAREAFWLVVLALGVGLASGTSAILLNKSVHAAIHYLEHWHGTIWMVLIPGVGAAMSAIYLRNILKDNSGHGVPDLIKGATLGGGVVPDNMIYSRLISSFLTVSSGGAAGLEGPIVVSGGGIGSYIGKLLKMNERRRILLLGYGVAGAIAAIFNAPLTGIVFSLEVILAEWSAMTVLPTIVSAVIATQLSREVMGNQIAFPHQVFEFGTIDLIVSAILGMVSGIMSVGFARTLFFTEHTFEQLTWPAWVKAGIGGLLVGAIGYFMPSVLHDGYQSIQDFLSGNMTTSFLAIAIFIVLKFIAVNLTLGSGGSGGVFAPSLVLGSALGFGFGVTLETLFPNIPLAGSSAFALVGMAGMVAGLMHAPLTGMFLVLEITGSYRLMLPLMITSAMAMLVSYYFETGSVYTRNLMAGGYLARKGSDLHLLQTMDSKELIDQDSVTIFDDMLLKEFVELFKKARRNVFPVVDRVTGYCLGLVYLDDIRPYLFNHSLYNIMTMGEVMHQDLPIISSEESALSAIDKFELSGAWSLPVADREGRFIGMMSKSTLFDRYRRELIVHTG